MYFDEANVVILNKSLGARWSYSGTSILVYDLWVLHTLFWSSHSLTKLLSSTTLYSQLRIYLVGAFVNF